jgi:type IV pilus assembly protein PilX
MTIHASKFDRQRGVVLISALLLLIIMTILAMAMFRTNGVQELIAGNVREKQRAVQSAQDAVQYAETWLATGGNVLSNSVDCTTLGLVTYPSANSPSICSQPVASVDTALNVETVPWKFNGAELGFMFYPGATAGGSGGTSTGDMRISTTPSSNTTSGLASFYQVPRFYIALLPNYTKTLAMYRIDAWNWAGTQNTAAVIESNYVVVCNTCSVVGL